MENKSYIEKIINKLSIVGLYGLTMLLFSCSSNKVEEIAQFQPDEKHPDMAATNYELSYSDSAIVRFKMLAPEIKKYEGKESFIEFPRGITVQKTNKEQEVISQLTADYARYLESESKWIAENNVIAVNEKGDSLLTEELIWDEKKQNIYSEKRVKIIKDDQEINGVGFVSDQNMENWEIKKPTGEMYLELDN